VAVRDAVANLEKNLEITNIDEFEYSVRESKPVTRGVPEGLKKESQKSRRRITAAAKKGEISLEFSLMNGAPVIWVHNVLTSKDPEIGILKKAGFAEEPAFWRLEVTRTSIIRLFTRLETIYPQVRVADWESFKKMAHKVFPGLNLDPLDGVGEKTK